MKKLLFIALSIFGIASLGLAVGNSVWISSNTATADTTKNLCPGQTYVIQGSTVTEGNHGVFHGACINAGATGTLTIYNSSATANIPIAAITTSTAMPCSLYDVQTSSGLTYTNSATANVTILYQCY